MMSTKLYSIFSDNKLSDYISELILSYITIHDVNGEKAIISDTKKNAKYNMVHLNDTYVLLLDNWCHEPKRNYYKENMYISKCCKMNNFIDIYITKIKDNTIIAKMSLFVDNIGLEMAYDLIRDCNMYAKRHNKCNIM